MYPGVKACFIILLGWYTPRGCLLLLEARMSWVKRVLGRSLCSTRVGVMEKSETAVGFLLRVDNPVFKFLIIIFLRLTVGNTDLFIWVSYLCFPANKLVLFLVI